MMVTQWVIGAAGITIVGLTATTAQALTAAAVADGLKVATAAYSMVEKANTHCGRRRGRRVCWRVGPHRYDGPKYSTAITTICTVDPAPRPAGEVTRTTTIAAISTSRPLAFAHFLARRFYQFAGDPSQPIAHGGNRVSASTDLNDKIRALDFEI
jgi:hypothetical protein